MRIDERLVERNLGIAQGLAYRDVAKNHPNIWSAWKKFEPLPPEADAESDALVVSRLESALYSLAAQYPGDKVAVVGHGACMRCLLKESGSLGNASITTLILGPGRAWRLVEVDDEGHLEAPSLRLGDLSDPKLPRPMLGLPVTMILLCRHGASDGNRERRFQGTLDLPLSEAGRRQAQSLGHALKPLGLAALWTSPLSRAQDTAREISAIIGLNSRADARLMERDLGTFQGVTFEQVKHRWPDAWAAWRSYMPLPPEVGAEPGPKVKEKLESALFELAQLYPGKTVAVVIHGGNARCLLKRSIGTGSITRLQVGPGHEWHLQELGNAQHLPKELAADALKASKL
jgi:probable phosphoglycerate mutase